MFNEPISKRRAYASALWLTPKFSKIKVTTPENNKKNFATVLNMWLVYGLSLILSLAVLAKYLQVYPYLRQRADIYVNVFFAGLVGIGIFLLGISAKALTHKLAQQTAPDFISELNDIRTGQTNNISLGTMDEHLLSDGYVLLTYLTQEDKAKHKAEIEKIKHDHAEQQLVVYVLPYRVPYMVQLDDYIFCYVIKDRNLRLLGIVNDNTDHSMMSKLVQSHKLGELAPFEEVEKNCEIIK